MTDPARLHWDPNAARLAGALYLAIAVCGGFSIGYVPMQIVADDAATSVANLLAYQGLFKLGVLADSAVILFELAITAILYHMFRHVGPKMALVAVISRLGMIVVMGVNILLWVMPYILLTGSPGLDDTMLTALAQFCFDAHAMGVFVWQLFFGAHLLALGWLILKSDVVPHLLGWGLFIGAVGYLIQGVARLTFTQVAVIDYTYVGLLVVVTLSEISFGLWLLIRGGRSPQNTHIAPAAA
ncbi:DUF4386 domain-containing protein [Rhodobacteraceae bacterium N5(2021)]|uniref:DUF4386 domain-containing protein n=1 Tax=Gymnodinialimonas phycosphaerae TaxID=2841589 RepID=A0A975TXY9_9RHOB|nr:DUF4386 domain-containing protein [Gymnodinialimonas phycosphaerae]MBY4891931.1 DUF4386 domain-containing protein [Gymnodinialimonas phycosphaerae]